MTMKLDSYQIGKRIMDICFSIGGIILFSPILIGTAIWIKMVSPDGPVFADIPLRVGKGGKNFRFLKFRSMIPHAHEWLQSRPELLKKWQDNNYKLDPDPRLIKGSLFIRKSSIDEMPQFFNVLIGDMSVVGPRAYHDFEIEAQLAKHPHLRDEMNEVLTVKPGITGLWQTSGRSQIEFEDRVKLDATYARKKSLMYDLILILKTPLVVITGKGAY
jgi:exopolysaccharide production protein ExoY